MVSMSIRVCATYNPKTFLLYTNQCHTYWVDASQKVWLTTPTDFKFKSLLYDHVLYP